MPLPDNTIHTPVSPSTGNGLMRPLAQQDNYLE